MLDFTYQSPTRFVLGRQAELQAGVSCRDFGLRRVLLHFGSHSAERSGLLDRVRESLRQSGIEFVELGGVVANPRDTLVYDGIDRCRRERIDGVLAVGGGSVLDSAKAIALGACYDGDFWDFFSDQAKPVRRLGLGTIVTLPATGSEGSNSAVIRRSSNETKRGCPSELNRPDFSLINPSLMLGLPDRQIAVGTVDMMSHVLERYFTNVPDVGFTDRLCEAVLCSIMEEAPRVLRQPRTYEAMANLMWASTQAHIGILGVGRQPDFSVHQLEHEVSGRYDTPHGAGLAALYPAWMTYAIDHDPVRMARLAARVFGVSQAVGDVTDPAAAKAALVRAAHAGIAAFSTFIRSLGLSDNLQGLGVRREDLSLMAAKVRRKKDGTVGFYLPMRDRDIKAVFELAYDWRATTA